ncbi:MAG: VWA domain-containing protein [Anaerolineae bacterium]|nr:VWA domain-containing protein [Anaerolineae bacterium]
MSFIWPGMLVSLFLVPLLILFYFRMQRRRRRLAVSYGNLRVAPGKTRDRHGLRRHLPTAISMAGLTILLLALARPQMVVNLPRVEGTVILAFDVSGSMGADDLKPTRLEAAKTAAYAFVQGQPPSVQIGVVAFSDNGFVVQAPTADQETILTTINRLGLQSGTSVANGILASLNTIATLDTQPAPRLYTNQTPAPTPTPTAVPPGTAVPAVIVLLTDGENNESPDPLTAAEAAADRGVRIYTVGIGSAAGTILQVDGFTIHTELNEAILQRISQITGGAYFSAENEAELLTVYENLDPQLVVKPEEMEVTSVLAGASILALLAGGALSVLWLGRLP